jgi:hypothetical protein
MVFYPSARATVALDYASAVIYYQEISTDHNTINWTASPPEITNYNIYRSDAQSGPWDAAHRVATVGAGALTYCDVGKGQADSTYWWYVVRGVDGYGVEETNSNAVQEPGGGAPLEFDLSVNAGWNLVSFPHIPASAALPGVLSDIGGDTFWDRVLWYNPRTPSDLWKQYNANWAGSLNDLTAVNNTMGVWLHVTSLGDASIRLAVSSLPTMTSINIKAGWNLIGFPSDSTTFTVGDLKASSGGVITIVEGYDGAYQYLVRQYADGEVMLAGRGYWVYAMADLVWNVPY